MTIPQTASVIGSGTMGPGIAATLVRAGMTVRVYDISKEALDRAAVAYDLAREVLDQLDTPEVPGGGVAFVSSLAEALEGTELVLEAVPERIELKKSVLAEIESLVGEGVLITTNTSGIPISDMAPTLAKADRFIGMHWSNPPHLIPMIEVIPGDDTSQDAIDATIAVIDAIGYHAVLEKEIAGFVENRVLYAIMRECLHMLQEGIVSQKDLDTCVKWGIGYKLSVVGPMRLLDMAGLDIYESVGSYLNEQLADWDGVPEVIAAHTERGELGMKTGGGLYEYGEGQVAATRADIVKGLVAARKTLSTIPVV